MTKTNPEIAENLFALKIYDSISQPVSRFFGMVPISAAEVLFYAFVLMCIFVFFGFIRKIVISRGERISVLGSGLLDLLCAMGIGFFLFMILNGTNYYRYDFLHYMNLQAQQTSSESLAGLCMSLAEKTNSARNAVMTDEDGNMQLGDVSAAALEAADAMSLLGDKYVVLKRYYPQPKPVLASKMMSYAQITGMFTAFTMEANINVDQPDYNIPADMCHELAHVAGFMREDEANFIAYLACTGSGSPEFVYSGMMSALINATNALYGEDVAEWEKVLASLDEGVINDLDHNSLYWRQFDNTKLGETIGSASTKLNDTYLKLNGQKDGVKSYGRMVDLLLAEYSENLN
ncbi:DUF3810 domain-containing protein [Parasporobacterium paucivorans]|uniref:DUF3810 domain-containing protein n=1 Tax=Parasporobacterium paucivorans TaxID=115544 RepID=UPI0015BB2BA8|nr:DUF3810 domain-containing protein [Parasporobacterium paucivorans]